MQRTATSIKNLLKIKTSELTGPALDWAVAKCESVDTTYYGKRLWYGPEPHDYRWEWCPSTDWAQGGPIIERELIELTTRGESLDMWVAKSPDWYAPAFGPTPLIAAMRCFVASELGDPVDIPGLLVIERSDPDVWIEWRRVSTIQERRFEAR